MSASADLVEKVRSLRQTIEDKRGAWQTHPTSSPKLALDFEPPSEDVSKSIVQRTKDIGARVEFLDKRSEVLSAMFHLAEHRLPFSHILQQSYERADGVESAAELMRRLLPRVEIGVQFKQNMLVVQEEKVRAQLNEVLSVCDSNLVLARSCKIALDSMVCDDPNKVELGRGYVDFLEGTICLVKAWMKRLGIDLPRQTMIWEFFLPPGNGFRNRQGALIDTFCHARTKVEGPDWILEYVDAENNTDDNDRDASQNAGASSRAMKPAWRQLKITDFFSLANSTNRRFAGERMEMKTKLIPAWMNDLAMRELTMM